MTEKWKQEKWAEDVWYRGKVTRRSIIGWGGGAIGAMILLPEPWREAFGAATPFKVGSEQPLSGPGAAGGKTASRSASLVKDQASTRCAAATSADVGSWSDMDVMVQVTGVHPKGVASVPYQPSTPRNVRGTW